MHRPTPRSSCITPGAPSPTRISTSGKICRWLADINGAELDLGAWGSSTRTPHVAFRATFIVDPDNVIQAVQVNGLNVGRNPAETLRVLDALQTDELCPCNWNKGDDVLQLAA